MPKEKEISEPTIIFFFFEPTIIESHYLSENLLILFLQMILFG